MTVSIMSGEKPKHIIFGEDTHAASGNNYNN